MSECLQAGQNDDNTGQPVVGSCLPAPQYPTMPRNNGTVKVESDAERRRLLKYLSSIILLEMQIFKSLALTPFGGNTADIKKHLAQLRASSAAQLKAGLVPDIFLGVFDAYDVSIILYPPAGYVSFFASAIDNAAQSAVVNGNVLYEQMDQNGMWLKNALTDFTDGADATPFSRAVAQAVWRYKGATQAALGPAPNPYPTSTTPTPITVPSDRPGLPIQAAGTPVVTPAAQPVLVSIAPQPIIGAGNRMRGMGCAPCAAMLMLAGLGSSLQETEMTEMWQLAADLDRRIKALPEGATKNSFVGTLGGVKANLLQIQQQRDYAAYPDLFASEYKQNMGVLKYLDQQLAMRTAEPTVVPDTPVQPQQTVAPFTPSGGSVPLQPPAYIYQSPSTPAPLGNDQGGIPKTFLIALSLGGLVYFGYHFWRKAK